MADEVVLAMMRVEMLCPKCDLIMIHEELDDGSRVVFCLNNMCELFDTRYKYPTIALERAENP